MGKYINTRTEDATLTPFKRCCLENFPFIEADFDALTNYELYCKVVEYLNKVIDQTNINTEAVEYIKNYFMNLDVQDEINNKLDQMASDGTLTDIIAQYLSLAGVLVYKNVDEMKKATNIISGSVCRTLGFYDIYDGGGAIYYITNSVDDSKVQILLDNTLYANLVNNNECLDIRSMGAKNEVNFDCSDIIQEAINKYNYIMINDKFYISKPITLKNDCVIKGTGCIYSDNPFIFKGDSINNIKIDGLELYSTVDTSDTASLTEIEKLKSIIFIIKSSNITITNTKIHDSYSGIYIPDSTNIIIDSNEIYNNSFINCCLSKSQFRIINNYIHDIKISNSKYPCYLIQATDNDLSSGQELSIISNNVLENNNVWDAIMMHRFSKINITNNTIKNVRGGIDLSLVESPDTGNMIIDNNYIEGTNIDSWNNEQALNVGIIVTGNLSQKDIVISNNIVKNFGRFNDANGYAIINITDSKNVIITGNIIEMFNKIVEIGGSVHLKGNLNNILLNNNILYTGNLNTINLNNVTGDCISIENNIINTENNTAINTEFVNVINNFKCHNNCNCKYEIYKRRNTFNNLKYNDVVQENNKDILTFNLASQTIDPLNEKRVFINKNSSNYLITFNNTYEYHLINDLGNHIITKINYSDSDNLELYIINVSNSQVTVNTQDLKIEIIK